MRRAGVAGIACLLAVVVCPAAPLRSWAQESATEPDPVLAALEGRVGKFFEAVSMGQAQSAYQELLTGSQLLKQADALKQLVERTSEIESRYGRFRDYERIAVRRAGADLVLLKYLYKCDSYPVVWHFAFYRVAAAGEAAAATNGTWRIVSVRFDSDLRSLEP